MAEDAHPALIWKPQPTVANGLLDLVDEALGAGGDKTTDQMDLRRKFGLELTVRVDWHAGATDSVDVEIYTAPDGEESSPNWDTISLPGMNLPASPGAESQKSIPINGNPRYIKAKIINNDGVNAQTIKGVWASPIGREERTGEEIVE